MDFRVFVISTLTLLSLKITVCLLEINIVFVKTSQFLVMFFSLEDLVFFKCTLYIYIDDAHATII
jgi:hypothetical protein